ncbi:nucleotidyltransferase family protein [Candidatus Woesearchaeota archaeon]|nr:nucleotidyltransferase family protein [Candidatus Woesearchaeota archaeon]
MLKAIILGAGYATRLYPLTLDTPKPLLDVGEKLMVEHIIERIVEMNQAGRIIEKIIIVTNSKFFPHFDAWNSGFDCPIELAIIDDGTTCNEDRLGAIGDMDFVIKKEAIDDDALVIAGDNLFDFSLADMHSFFIKKQASVIAVYDMQDRSLLARKLGVVELDKDQRIIGFEEKPDNPKSSLASTACYMFSKDDMAELERCIAEHKKPDNTGDFVRYLSSKKPVYGYSFRGRWFDIGSKEQLEHVRKLYRDRK